MNRRRNSVMLPLHLAVPSEMRTAIIEVSDAEGISIAEAARGLLRSGLQARGGSLDV